MNYPHPQPLYLKTREIDRQPLDARHRGEARVISLIKAVKTRIIGWDIEPE
jgi:hypothetical protein